MRCLRVLRALLPLLALTGCSTVRPWQHESLTLPGMALAPALDDEIDQHVVESREGSSGGYGSVGGGCGCN